MRPSLLVRAVLPLALGLGLCATAAGAQNLITNPDFDSDDADWFHDTSQNQQWSSADADLCASSGSLTAEASTTSPSFQAFSTRPTDCLPVTPDETVELSVRVRLSASDVITRLYLTYCTDSVCQFCGSFSPYLDYGTFNAGVWSTLRATHTIPSSNVGSVFFSVNASEAAATPFVIDLDRASFRRDGLIFGDDFEIGEACRWSYP